ncbi:hypothetical protein ACJ41O_005603 [Fusarium nematophilum]
METVSLSDWAETYKQSQHQREDGSPPDSDDGVDSSRRGPQTLSPAAVDDEVQCRFSWGDYETLSYTWGSASDPPRSILINGQGYRVQRNLHDALSQFRMSRRYASRMRIWIDAICINQGDIIERATQVKRMRQIYSTAVRTVVWLGKDLGPVYSALIDTRSYVEQLTGFLTRTAELMPVLLPSENNIKSTVSSSSVHHWSTSSFTNQDMIGSGSDDSGITSDDDDASSTSGSVDDDDETTSPQRLLIQDEERLLEQLDLSRGFHDFPFQVAGAALESYIYLALVLQPIIQNEYWRRVWIVQELSMSSRASLVVIGSSAFPLAQLLEVAGHLPYSMIGLWLLTPHLYASRPAFSNSNHFTSLLRSITSTAGESTSWTWMLQGLLSRSSLASDKFYGILGLLDSDQLSDAVVDYTRPVHRVSIDATCVLMYETRHLSQFFICTPVASPDLPSWALDLTQDYDRFTNLDMDVPNAAAMRGSNNSGAAAHRGSSAQWGLSSARVVDRKTLMVRGSVLDEVDGMGFYPEEMLSPVPAGRRRKEMHLSISNPTTESHAYGDATAMLRALDKLLLSSTSSLEFQSLFHMPMFAVQEGEPCRPALYPEGMEYSTAVMLLELKHFCEANARFDLWGIRFGSLFPGLREEARERVSGSQERAYQALCTLEPSYQDACDDWNKILLTRRRLISTTAGRLGMATPFAARGDKICAVQGFDGLVVLRPEGGYFEFVGLVSIVDVENEAEQMWDGKTSTDILLR